MTSTRRIATALAAGAALAAAAPAAHATSLTTPATTTVPVVTHGAIVPVTTTTPATTSAAVPVTTPPVTVPATAPQPDPIPPLPRDLTTPVQTTAPILLATRALELRVDGWTANRAKVRFRCIGLGYVSCSLKIRATLPNGARVSAFAAQKRNRWSKPQVLVFPSALQRGDTLQLEVSGTDDQGRSFAAKDAQLLWGPLVMPAS
jgi:hypothetical protein